MTDTDDFKFYVDNAVLCWLATVDSEGTPNVSPKEIFTLYGDDHLVVADIASPHSVRNIHSNPKVCVSFVDVFRQRGFKVVGTARIIASEDPLFSQVGAELLRMAGDSFPVRHVIEVKIEKVSRILAPSYTLVPERTDQERLRMAYEAYGVRPADAGKIPCDKQ